MFGKPKKKEIITAEDLDETYNTSNKIPLGYTENEEVVFWDFKEQKNLVYEKGTDDNSYLALQENILERTLRAKNTHYYVFAIDITRNGITSYKHLFTDYYIGGSLDEAGDETVPQYRAFLIEVRAFCDNHKRADVFLFLDLKSLSDSSNEIYQNGLFALEESCPNLHLIMSCGPAISTIKSVDNLRAFMFLEYGDGDEASKYVADETVFSVFKPTAVFKEYLSNRW